MSKIRYNTLVVVLQKFVVQHVGYLVGNKNENLRDNRQQRIQHRNNEFYLTAIVEFAFTITE